MAQLGDVDLLSRLVAFPSVSSQSNRPIAEFIADYLDQAAISVQLLDSGDLDKANLIAQVGPPVGEHRGGLVLSGHMDVVPAEESGWQSDPFVLSLRDGRYYGRGSADMKGFLALATQLLREAATAKLRRPLWLIFTRDEEVGTLGAQDLAQSWPSERLIPRNAIIGEPSSMRVVRMHKGHFTFDLEVRGKSAHSAYPHLGDNAIESAAKAVAALRDLRLELAEERCASSEFFGDVPYAPLNLGRIQGGAAVNIVADRCAIQLGARPLPGMDTEQLQRRVQRCIGSALAGHDYSLVAGSESPPLLLEPQAPVYQALSECIGQQDTVGVSYATDAGWLQRLGLDCVIWGPGAIEVAHKPNEFMPQDEFAQARQVLGQMVRRFCCQDVPS